MKTAGWGFGGAQGPAELEMGLSHFAVGASAQPQDPAVWARAAWRLVAPGTFPGA